jgi:hypothetical protein
LYIIIKGSIHQEDKAIINIFTKQPNTQIYESDTNGVEERNSFTITIRDHNTLHSKMGRTSRQNINREIGD